MDAIKTLRSEIEKAGGQRAWARKSGISVAYVNDVLHGRRPPGEAILNAIGLTKVIKYQKAKP